MPSAQPLIPGDGLKSHLIIWKVKRWYARTEIYIAQLFNRTRSLPDKLSTAIPQSRIEQCMACSPGRNWTGSHFRQQSLLWPPGRHPENGLRIVCFRSSHPSFLHSSAPALVECWPHLNLLLWSNVNNQVCLSAVDIKELPSLFNWKCRNSILLKNQRIRHCRILQLSNTANHEALYYPCRHFCRSCFSVGTVSYSIPLDPRNIITSN